MPDRGGAPGGTLELYFTDPDGLAMQLQDTSYCSRYFDRLLGPVQGTARDRDLDIVRVSVGISVPRIVKTDFGDQRVRGAACSQTDAGLDQLGANRTFWQHFGAALATLILETPSPLTARIERRSLTAASIS